MAEGTLVGTAYLEIIPSAKGFAGKLQGEVGGEVAAVGESSGAAAGEKAGSSFGGRFKDSFMEHAKDIAKTMGLIFTVDKGVELFKSSIESAEAMEKTSRQTEAVIKSTGGAAHVSAAQVEELSTSISNQTGKSVESVQAGANMLLTFKNIRNESGKNNDIFNRSTQTIQDMAAAMGGGGKGSSVNVKSQAILLGKALNDPVKGLTALTRVGVSFTDQQKKQITQMVKSGNTLGAQKIILKELNSEFGGSAKAQTTAADKARNAWHNFQIALGDKLLPIVDKVAVGFTHFITGMQKGTGVGGAVAHVFTTIGSALKAAHGWLIPLMTALASAAVAYKAVAVATNMWRSAMGGVRAVMGGISKIVGLFTAETEAATVAQEGAAGAAGELAAATEAEDAAMTANPIGLIVAALAALVAALVYAYKHSQTFRKIVQGAFAAVRAVAQTVAHVFSKVLGPAFHVVAVVAQAVMGTVRRAFSGGFNAVRGAVTSVLGFIRKHWGLIISIMGGPIGAVVVQIIKHWSQIRAGISNLIGWIASVPGRIKGLAGAFLGAGAHLISSLISGLGHFAGSVGNIGAAIWNSIRGFLNAHLPHSISINKGPIHLSIPLFPTFATGTDFAPGGTALVGEQGPELVNLPRGSQVIPAHRTAQMLHETPKPAAPAHAAASGAARFTLVLDDGTALTGHIREVADEQVNAAHALAAQTARAR